MGFIDIITKKEKVIQEEKPTKQQKISVYVPTNPKVITQQFKGEVETTTSKFDKDVGEEHPFDYSTTEGLYKKFGLINGVVDKVVDFVVGPGFFVKSEDPRAQEIISNYLRDVNFDTILRAWTKESLIKGSGYIELGGKKDEPPKGMKILDAKYMYKRRDKKGKLLGYTQWSGQKINSKKIYFDPSQVASFNFNQVGNDPYGLGLISPAVSTIENLMNMSSNLHMLMERKANSPLHVKLGTTEDPASAADVADFGQDLEYLKNYHEWATDHRVEMKVVDFGNIGERFDAVMTYDLDMLFFTFQVPEVLMGRGSIPEGLAKVQLEAFERRIQSIQAELEKVIESEIFTRVLAPQGIYVHVEFEWGKESDSKKNERIRVITELLKLFDLNPKLRNALEKELAKLLNIGEAEIEEMEEQREREAEEPQPTVPGSNRKGPTEPPSAKEANHCDCHPLVKEGVDDVDSFLEGKTDYSLKEWIGFDYSKFVGDIISFVDSQEFVKREYIGFSFLPGTNQAEWEEILLKYNLKDNLSNIKVNRLRSVLTDAFKEGSSMTEIAKNIKFNVKPGDLEVKVPPLYDKDGVTKLRDGYTRRIPETARSVHLARTETIRASAQGSLKNYANGGIKIVRWVSGAGDRTCAYCMAQNGRIFTLQDANERIPAHSSCRCTFVPIVE